MPLSSFSGACLSLQNFFASPFKAELLSYQCRFAWSNYSFSDCIAYLYAFKVSHISAVEQLSCVTVHIVQPLNLFVSFSLKTYEAKNESHEFLTHRSRQEWCRRNFIQINRLKEAEDLISDLTERLKRFNIKVPVGPAYKKNDMWSPKIQILLKVG